MRSEYETLSKSSGVLRRQWSNYSAGHQHPTNLLIHLFAVPLFMLATIGVISAVIWPSWTLGIFSLIGMFVSVALQGRGHALEPVKPEPFSGGLNFLRRLFGEQWITFPRFFFSGSWLRNYANNRRR